MKTNKRSGLAYKASLVVIGAISVLVIASGAFAEAKEQEADWVLTNGKIYTVNQQEPWAEAIAIRGGKIVYVGDNTGAVIWSGSGTKVSDLGGKLVLPGLVDAHTHPGLMGMFSKVAPITEDDPAKLSDWLKSYAEDNPELPVIVAGSWYTKNYGVQGPHKRELDAVVSDRPVVLMDESGHSTWSNSKAFEALGIDSKTPDPVPGLSYHVRGEQNEPTGWSKEFAVAPLFELALQPGDMFEQTVTDFLDYLVSQGVTTLFDGGNLGWSEKVYPLLARLETEGRLPLRYEGSYHVYLKEHFSVAISELKRLRRTYGGDRLTFNTIKIHYDGVPEIRTAAVSESFSDDRGNRGKTIASETELADFIRQLSQEKMDLHIHVVGDRATHQALNAYELVKKELGDELYTRLTLTHLSILNDEDVPRFKALGVVANFTPHWHGKGGHHEGSNNAVLGERANRMMRVQPLLSDGAWVSFSSDVIAPGPDRFGRANPYLGMQIAHNRQEAYLGKDAVVVPPLSTRLSLDDLIRGYTYSGAYQLRKDDQLGSIEEGKSADLVVLNRNLFEMNRYEIQRPKVAMTIMEGEVIYKRDWRAALSEWYNYLLINLYVSFMV